VRDRPPDDVADDDVNPVADLGADADLLELNFLGG
jgi:hypothetical protein